MSAGKYDILIEQGASFSLIVNIDSVGIDLADYNARAQLRKDANDSNILSTFTIAITSATQLEMTLTAIETAQLVTTGVAWNNYTRVYYDLEIEHKTTSAVIRLLNGAANISPEVTK